MKGFLLVSALAAVSGFSVSVRSPAARMRSLRMSSDDYTVAILGDLHLDPRYMEVRAQNSLFPVAESSPPRLTMSVPGPHYRP